MDWESLVWNTSLPPTRKFLLAALARHADPSGFAQMTTLQLAATTGLGSRTVREQMALAEATGNVRRFPNIGFRITLIPTDSTGGTSRRVLTHADSNPTPDRRNLPPHVDTGRLNRRNVPPHGISGPYKERTSETPSGFPLVISPILSSPEVLENKELGQEGISITREGQGELISTETPAWLTNLRTTPGYDLDAAHERRLIARVGTNAISTPRLCETSAAIAAKWESVRWSPSNRRGYKRIDLTFIAWASREGFNADNGRYPRRYRAPGTDIPKAGTPEAYARWPKQEWPA